MSAMPSFARRTPESFRLKTSLHFTYEEINERFKLPEGFPNEQQLYAINLIVNWFRGWQLQAHGQQVFKLAGYAGTGKTSIANIVVELCCGSKMSVFIAPTGKAAARLRQKGCVGARTLHQFIYRPAGENEDGDPIFVDKGSLDITPTLVCMDESSMVGERDNRNLLDRGLPVLALYDPGQVPPVKDRQVYDYDGADIVLDQIERNAGNIVKASMVIRKGKFLPEREYEDVSVQHSFTLPDEEFMKFLDEDGIILAARNATREKMNRRARRLLGWKGDLPEIGEKVVATANQHEHGIMNGEQAIVMGFKDLPEGAEDEDWDEMCLMQVKMLNNGFVRWVEFNPAAFDTDLERKKAAQKCSGGFDFGYAMTVHKSQGSEWLRVLVFEESIPGVNYAQIMYTAVTRAIQYLKYCRQG